MKFTKETVKRMARTFLQTALGYILVNIACVDISSGKDALKSTLVGLGVSAVASGVAAVMNLERNNENTEDDEYMDFDEEEEYYE